MGVSAGIAAVTDIASTVMNNQAAGDAANAQSSAQGKAAGLYAQQQQTIDQNFSPATAQGIHAGNELNTLLPGLTAQFNPTMDQLAATPGYQFTLQQGEQATQNSFAAQGLASSGAAEKGAANYAEGLASNTYQQQFQNYLDQNKQIYNMWSGQQKTGLDAATTQGQLGLTAAGGQANALVGQGNAQAAGIIGQNNALTSGIGQVGGLGTDYSLSKSGNLDVLKQLGLVS